MDEEPKKSWWARLNEKPEDWDTWSGTIARIVMAIALGVGLFWIQSKR